MTEEIVSFKVADFALASVVYALNVCGVKDFIVLTVCDELRVVIDKNELFKVIHNKNHDDEQHDMDMDIVAHPFKPVFEPNPYDYAIKTNIQQEEDK